MELDKLIKIIKESKSKNEILIKFFGYSNGSVCKKLNDYISKYNIDISHIQKKDKFCIECGKKIIIKANKFCNSSCAAKFNNKKRVYLKSTAIKISKALSGRVHNYCVKNSESNNFKLKSAICVICNKEFDVERKNNKYSKSTTCSNECHVELAKIRGQESAAKIIREGRHKGWNSRNIISYPEKFFIKVLKLNKIKFEHNYPISKKSLGINSCYNYFLDFYIKDKKIDLEIDGKQHLKREEHDGDRDSSLIKNGFYVYRIKWKSINTENGKKYIKKEIEKFLDFYNKK